MCDRKAQQHQAYPSILAPSDHSHHLTLLRVRANDTKHLHNQPHRAPQLHSLTPRHPHKTTLQPCTHTTTSGPPRPGPPPLSPAARSPPPHQSSTACLVPLPGQEALVPAVGGRPRHQWVLPLGACACVYLRRVLSSVFTNMEGSERAIHMIRSRSTLLPALDAGAGAGAGEAFCGSCRRIMESMRRASLLGRCVCVPWVLWCVAVRSRRVWAWGIRIQMRMCVSSRQITPHRQPPTKKAHTYPRQPLQQAVAGGRQVALLPEHVPQRGPALHVRGLELHLFMGGCMSCVCWLM